MKIDIAKAAADNVLLLIKDKTGVTLTTTQVTLGDPVPWTDPNGVYNTRISVNAVKNKGYSGGVTLNYTRLTVGQVWPSMNLNWAVGLTDTPTGMLSKLVAALGMLSSEVTINSGNVLTLPTASNPTVVVNLVAKTTSKVLAQGSNMNVNMNYTLPVVEVTSSTSGNNLNTLSLLGNPTAVADYRLTLTGIIGSTTAATAALTVGVLPAGSMLTIINQGTIQGKGGDGGAYNTAGGVGGNAIRALMDFKLSTAVGKVFGGGGGGAGGYQTFAMGLNYLRSAGGGGAGNAVGAVGTGSGLAGLALQTNNAAAAGTASAGGVGAKTSNMNDATQYSQAGSGGLPGTAGGNSTVSKGTNTSAVIFTFSGGGAGKAIDLNGRTVTIVAGNNSTQIKGLVS